MFIKIKITNFRQTPKSRYNGAPSSTSSDQKTLAVFCLACFLSFNTCRYFLDGVQKCSFHVSRYNFPTFPSWGHDSFRERLLGETHKFPDLLGGAQNLKSSLVRRNDGNRQGPSYMFFLGVENRYKPSY